MQATRERINREGSNRSRTNLRCSVCHNAITGDEYVVELWRRLRICPACDEQQEGE